MTERLFWKNPYMKECHARVVKSEGDKVYLDRTVFFAFSGGQASDSGRINSAEVKEAVDDKTDVFYVLEGNTLKAGDDVKVEIDWERRFTIMRLHSAAHIVWKFLVDEIGLQKMIGSNVSFDRARIDIIYEKPLTETAKALEGKVNDFLKEGHDIKTYGDPEKPGRRVWEIEDFDRMPCGGTHVKNTREIERVSIKRRNIGAGKERLEICL